MIYWIVKFGQRVGLIYWVGKVIYLVGKKVNSLGGQSKLLGGQNLPLHPVNPLFTSLEFVIYTLYATVTLVAKKYNRFSIVRLVTVERF